MRLSRHEPVRLNVNLFLALKCHVTLLFIHNHFFSSPLKIEVLAPSPISKSFQRRQSDCAFALTLPVSLSSAMNDTFFT